MTPITDDKLAELRDRCDGATEVGIGSWQFKDDGVTFDTIRSLITRLQAAEGNLKALGQEAFGLRTQLEVSRKEAANWLRLHDEQEARAEAAEHRWEVFCDWYLREGKRREVHPNGHIIQTTRQHLDDWAARTLLRKEETE